MSHAGPLLGYTVAVTADRLRREFGAALEARGARVVYAPAMRIVAPAEDPRLRAATENLLRAPAGLVVITTAAGFAGWLTAARTWQLAEPLHERLLSSECLARGPDARIALAALGIITWAPPHDSAGELVTRLRSLDLDGRTVWVQTHGAASGELLDELTRCGARPVPLPVFGWVRPADPAPVRQLCVEVAGRHVDAVAFTSSAAVAGLLDVAVDDGLDEQVLDALTHDVSAACIGPITAARLLAMEVPVVLPPRPRLAALVREIARRVPVAHGQVLAAAGHRLEVRAHAVLVDGAPVTVSSDIVFTLRTLGAQAGAVVADKALSRALQQAGHSPDTATAIARLRTALGDSRIVEAVSGGYRLAHGPAASRVG